MKTALLRITLLAALQCFFLTSQSQSFEEITKNVPELRSSSAGIRLGYSVAVDGSQALIGAPFDSENGDEAGAAYLFRYNTTTGEWDLFRKFMPEDGKAGDHFGHDVAFGSAGYYITAPFDDDRGTNAGAVYIFDASATIPRLKFYGSDLDNLDNFGYSISVLNNSILVGAPYDDDEGSNAGAAYYFERVVSSGSSITVTERYKFTAAGSAQANANFGWDVAISSGSDGQYVVIGAPNYDRPNSTNDGRAYVFSGNGSSWSSRGTLSSFTTNAGERFGYSVGIYRDDRIIVGAPNTTIQLSAPMTTAGAAYIFHNTGLAGTQTFRGGANQDKLSRDDNDINSNDNFGISVGVTLDGGYKYFVGSRGDDDASSNSGAIYVYTETSSTVGSVTTSREAKLVSDGTSVYLGQSIGFDGGRLVSGAEFSDIGENNTGAFYSYSRASGGSWTALSRGTPPPYASSLGDEMGHAVDIDGVYAVVGAPNDDVRVGPGSAYVLEHTAAGWVTRAKLTASDGIVEDAFGYAVTISGDYIAIGAPLNDAESEDDGAVYIFEKPVSGWEDMTETQKLLASNGTFREYFGRSVDLEGNVLIAGADGGPSASSGSSGIAYVFEKSSSWIEKAILEPSDGASSDDFGGSVAIAGEVIVVGAPEDDDGQRGSGSAYLFEMPQGGWSGTLTESAKLTASNPSRDAYFGTSAAMQGDVVVIGARTRQTAYVFEKPLGGWTTSTETARLTGTGQMGQSVAISGDIIVAGAYTCCTSGGVYIFNKEGANWTTQEGTNPLQASDGAEDDWFGYSVAMSGQSLIVGAVRLDEYSGSAYTYELPVAPSDLVSSSVSIPENSSAAATIGILTSVDANLVETHTYTLSGEDAASFQIGGDNSDELQIKAPFDFEVKSTYEIDITTTDTRNLTRLESFTISVTDVPENPTDISLSGSTPGTGGVETVTVLQNQPIGYVIGTLTTTDQDAEATFTYTIGGTDEASFQIGGTNSDELQAAAVFDHDVKNVFEINITTTDNDGLTYIEDFTIEVLPNQTPTDIEITGTTVTENNDASTLVGTLTTTDADVADTHTYSISGTDESSFVIGGTNDDELYTTESFDFETKEGYTITIRTDDGLGGVYDEEFTIEVINVNDNSPTDITLDNSSINENVESGVSIATMSTTDGDTEDAFTYTLSGTDAESFSIGGENNDELLSAEVFDFEVKSSYQITITTTDAGGITYDKDFTISVVDINDDPTAVQLSNNTIQENLDAGTAIGELTTTDQDEADTHTYTITGEDEEFFGIDGANVVSAVVFDFETKDSYSITITTTDAGGLQFSDDFIITITNENEVATAIAFVDGDNEIEENASVGTAVGTLETTDVDAEDTHTYSITGPDEALFDIDGANVVSTAVFDFETKDSYSITITTTDAGGLQFSDDFTIQILDGPDAPTEISLSSDEIEENLRATAVIGELSTTDVDAGDSHTYSITGTDALSFEVDGVFLISAGSFDFETKNTYSITITTKDQADLTYSEDFTINVTDVLENPTDISLSGSFPGEGEVETVEILQNQPIGYVIGSLTSADQDAGATFTYTIGGTDADGFKIGGTGNDELQAAAVFDHGEQSVFNITITTTDNDGLTYMENFIIEVLPNQSPTDIDITGTTVTENSAASTLVGTLNTTDADVADTHTYSISGTDATSFTIGGTNDDELYTTESFDFETKESYTITIRTDDGLGGTYDKEFTITVLDVNEAPYLSSEFNREIAFPENSDAIVFDLPVADEVGDEQDVNVTYAFAETEASADRAFFNIDANTGVITFKTPPNFDTAADADQNNVYLLEVVASDAALSTNIVLTVTITDIDEAPVFESAVTANFDENAEGTIIDINANDGDDGEADANVTYSLTAPDDAPKDQASLDGFNNELFSIDENSGVLTFIASPDFEDPQGQEGSNDYEVLIFATDGTSTTTQVITITVLDVNEVPVFESENQPDFPENSENVIIDLFASDEVNGEEDVDITYSITGGVDQELFSIDAETGELSFVSPPDFEIPTDADELNDYEVQVTATDAGQLSTAFDMTITVTNVADAPIFITESAVGFAENRTGLVVDIDANDGDGGEVDAGLTYSITGGEDAAFFEINETTGELNMLSAKNFEAPSDEDANNAYLVEITAADSELSSVLDLTVSIVNVNENVVDILLSNTDVNENAPQGTLIGQLTAVDLDRDGSYIYSLVSNTEDNEPFGIEDSRLVTKTPLDFEEKSSYNVRIQVNNDGLIFQKTFRITVNDLNETPSDITLSSNSIKENVPVGTTVGGLTAFINNTEIPAVFVIENASEEPAVFILDEDTIRSALPINYEDIAEYSVTISVTEGNKEPFTKTFVIEVLDVNDSPSKITPSNLSIDENIEIGTIISTFLIEDEDDASHVLSFASGEGSDDNAKFSLENGRLATLEPVDFESQSSYNIRIRAEDDGGLSYESAFVIKVNNVNDAPTAINLSTNVVAENSATDIPIGEFSTIDDDADDIHTYTLVTGEGSDDNASFEITGNLLYATQSFDFETNSLYTIRVSSEDQEGASIEAVFTISVTNVEEPPTIIFLSNNRIDENLEPGVVLGELSVNDAMSPFTFSLVPGEGAADNGSFSIDGNSLVSSVSFDYEVQPSLSIRISATDGQGIIIEQVFIIEILDVVEIIPTFEISGTVTGIDNAPLTDVAVQLYIRENGSWALLETIDGLESGGYVFDGLLEGEYTIGVVPGLSIVSQYAATYLGGKLSLSSSEILIVDTDKSADIAMKLISQTQGNGGQNTLSGTLAGIPGSGTTNDDEPIADVQIFLIDLSTGEIVGSAVTDANGEFIFEGLLEGDYQLAIDIDGQPVEGAEITVTNGENIQLDLTVQENGVILVTEVESTVTGLNEIALSKLVSLYPIPAQDHVTLYMYNEGTGQVNIRLMTISGQIVNQRSFNKVGLEHREPISMQGLASGIYMLVIDFDDITITKRILK